MTLLSSVLLLIALSIVAVGVSVGLGHAPTAKRTHLFETDDGERARPFRDFSAGADAPPTCRRCRRHLSSGTHRYCTRCLQ